MIRWSVSSETRRDNASPRTCCARLALAFTVLAVFVSRAAIAQSPLLRAPDAVTDVAGSAAGAADPATQDPTDAVLPIPTPPIPPQPADIPAVLPQPADVPQIPPQPAAPPTKSPPKESDDLATALERRGDLNLHGLTLNAALFTISEQWNINIVAGEVQGTVNGVFKQAPLREILDAILLSNGYNYRAVGKSLVVSSVQALGQVNPFFQSATIRVRTADIDEVVEGAKLLTTPQGQVRALKSAHSIVVLDFPDRVEMIRKFVAAVDGASGGQFSLEDGGDGSTLEVGYFRTQHISAKTAADALQAVLSKEGKVAVMEKEDRLLVTDHVANLVMIEKVLGRIDYPRPQVRITALIYDISLQDLERIGINWNPEFHGRIDSSGNPGMTLDIDSITQVPFQANAVGNTLTFMNLSRNLDLTAVVRCMQQANDARLLADPNVCVLENEEAIFQSVSEIPYQQLTQTQQGGQIGTTAFKTAGTTLHVTPKISADGLIRMQVMPEFSRLTGFTPGDNQPIIDVRSASTTLSIANRQTVVIGGLRQRQDIGEFTGVPYLKDLKLVGRLFRSHDTDVRESELVVFIMPEIIDYADVPSLRQQMVADTIHCRLAQIPEAEGCPPCCRRLPPETGIIDSTHGEESGQNALPPGDKPAAVAPPPDPANNSSPADVQQPDFADGRIRRLPSVEPAAAQVVIKKNGSTRLFTAPTELEPEVRTADRVSDIWR